MRLIFINWHLLSKSESLRECDDSCVVLYVFEEELKQIDDSIVFD